MMARWILSAEDTQEILWRIENTVIFIIEGTESPQDKKKENEQSEDE